MRGLPVWVETGILTISLRPIMRSGLLSLSGGQRGPLVMKKDLLFEVGAEEIPAGFVPMALASLQETLKGKLASGRLSFDNIRTLGTPRRLTLIVEGLIDRQPDARIEVRGPNKKAAFDEAGRPTRALEGFAKAQGVKLKDVKLIKTDKGEHVLAVKEVKGEKTAKILPGILSEVLSIDMFPKSMRWGDYDVSFARPVHWILAVYDGRKVSFEYGHLKSSNRTFGHRFLVSEGKGGKRGGKSREKKGANGRPISVAGVDEYLDALSSSFVVVDPDERRRLIEEGLSKEAEKAGGVVLPDPGLLEEVTYLVEYPVVVRGSFEKEFLKLPRDVVINAMREHQRYFSIADSKGRLLPCFLTVANTKATSMDVVRKGNERVLRARLNDAKFYFEQDIKVPLVDYVERLKGVIFQSKLGTSYEKVERFTALAHHVGSALGYSSRLEEGERPAAYLAPDHNPASYGKDALDPALYAKYVLGRGAMLAKADLTSGVVGEFPKLQGIIGGVYAERNGEAPEVSTVIVEHYMPTASGGELPGSTAGAIVSIADKLDTITGCFGVGLIPTGAQDPYALRRQALGIIAIILEKNFRAPLDGLVNKAVCILGHKLLRGADEVKVDVLEFFKDRLKNQLLGQGLSFDSIDSVLATDWYDIPDAVERIKAIEAFKDHPACPNLVVAFKRVSNILKGITPTGGPDPAHFKDEYELALHAESTEIAPVINEHWKNGEYRSALEVLASIKDTIDAFFDHVMVMVDDEATRTNRLALLSSVRELYFRISDLSRLTV